MNGNKCLLAIMQFLATFGRVRGVRRKQNHRIRLERIAGHMTYGYVEDQKRWTNVPFGRFTMAFSGCEIFAVYNALHYWNRQFGYRELAELIYAFEGKGAMLWGGFGTSPYALRDYFLQRDYVVKTTTSDQPKEIQKLEQENAVYILTAFNEGHNIFKQIHTVCITLEKDGWYLHNNGNKNTHGRYVATKYPSLVQAVRCMRSNSRLIYLMAIAQK
ncbi:MAG: C39 family peptidase [Lachnospiraceae bacterium]|nr:C39 family peptidase [Lachnospiraceae bacterium]